MTKKKNPIKPPTVFIKTSRKDKHHFEIRTSWK